MKNRLPYVLLACFAVVAGCRSHDKPAQQPLVASSVAMQATAPLNSAKVLPLLRKFKPKLGMEYVIDILGEPDINMGSACYSYFYPTTDGTNIFVQAHINPNYPRESKYGPVIKIEHGCEIIYDSRK